MLKTKQQFKNEFEQRIALKFNKTVAESNKGEQFQILGEMVRDYAAEDWKKTQDYIAETKEKELVYFSMEFLMGRLLTNNLINLGIYNTVKSGLADFNIDINDLEVQESDAGLGNGGLGRLAACFLDSIASLNYAGHGNTLRYEFGFFRQKIVDNRQVEIPDQWLLKENVWEVKKPEEAVDVIYNGYSEVYKDENGNTRRRIANGTHIKAVPYDMPVVGYENHVCNTLRLWSAEVDTNNIPYGMSFTQYYNETKEINQCLYPDDSTEHGKLLRLKQQYMLVSAGMQSVIKKHKAQYGTLTNLCEKHCFQLNDTHPTLSIPETMRILMDEEGFSWDDAWYQVTHMMAYTNHTILAEALEKWPVNYMRSLLPRIYEIIEEINRRICLDLKNGGYDDGFIYRTCIVKDNTVHMANLDIHAGYSVNGVAKLHTDICIKDTFKDFYKLYPEKFNNKTNGVTHRRWLLNCNPELASLITSLIGDAWIRDPSQLKELMKFQDDEKVLKKIIKIKGDNKKKLAEYIKLHNGVEVDPKSIFDTQVKRLHAYKRQFMNVLRIIYYYQMIKTTSSFKMTPRTFIFGAKAAPSYTFAKNVIELINCIANKVNNDPEVNKYMKVVFIENYDVSSAEVIIPGSDVSEQISTAGKEASGTSNMKFMINGAVTLGTLDGANVEINQLVGDANSVIFGLKDFELDKIRQTGSYNAWDIYNTNANIKMVMDTLMNGTWHQNHEEFRPIFDDIMWRNDEFFNLLDFEAYLAATKKTEEMYKDKMGWAKSCLVNIAKAGYFSSDRTIEQYVADIWHLNKIAYKD